VRGWTRCYPWIVHSARRIPVTRFLIDSEAVCCDQDDVWDFERIDSDAV
jgi:ATP-dependent DNA ligase